MQGREAGKYKKGMLVELTQELNDPYRKLPSGFRGKIQNVDDIGTIHVLWQTGLLLGLIPGEDHFKTGETLTIKVNTVSEIRLINWETGLYSIELVDKKTEEVKSSENNLLVNSVWDKIQDLINEEANKDIELPYNKSNSLV